MGSGNFDEVLAAARLAGIHEVITRLPHGYDTELGEDAVGLSGSERRRIEIARALYGRPRLLVLDEPTAFLDRAGRQALEAAVADLKRTGTTIFVTTQSSQATRWSRLADKILIARPRLVRPQRSWWHAGTRRPPPMLPDPGLRPVP